jgi:hypothetical protein
MYEETVEESESPGEDSATELATVTVQCEEANSRAHGCVEAVELQQKLQKLSVVDQNCRTTSNGQHPPFSTITTSLSLIEMLVRLAGLQEFQQTSHLSIPDHVLTFFLEESSTTGLVGEARRAQREAAEARVGFDPYVDSTPKKS